MLKKNETTFRYDSQVYFWKIKTKCQYLHLRKSKLYDIIKVWWEKMQNKRIVHDFERIKTNIKKRKEKKCLSFTLTFINMKI